MQDAAGVLPVLSRLDPSPLLLRVGSLLTCGDVVLAQDLLETRQGKELFKKKTLVFFFMDNCRFSESSQWFRRCFAENIKPGCFLNLPSVMQETLGQGHLCPKDRIPGLGVIGHFQAKHNAHTHMSCYIVQPPSKNKCLKCRHIRTCKMQYTKQQENTNEAGCISSLVELV